MAVYLPNISPMHFKCGLMSSKVRLDIASHLITIGFYRVWIIQFSFNSNLCYRYRDLN